MANISMQSEKFDIQGTREEDWKQKRSREKESLSIITKVMLTIKKQHTWLVWNWCEHRYLIGMFICHVIVSLFRNGNGILLDFVNARYMVVGRCHPGPTNTQSHRQKWILMRSNLPETDVWQEMGSDFLLYFFLFCDRTNTQSRIRAYTQNNPSHNLGLETEEDAGLI